MRSLLRTRRERGAYTVTDAQRPMSEDIAYRQRRYLISMGIRVVAFLLAVFLFHGVWRFVAAGVSLVVPYFAVVFANGGREPDNAARFETFRPRLPTRHGDLGASGDALNPGAPTLAGEADTAGSDVGGGTAESDVGNGGGPAQGAEPGAESAQPTRPTRVPEQGA